jgi:hypothetical protein
MNGAGSSSGVLSIVPHGEEAAALRGSSRIDQHDVVPRYDEPVGGDAGGGYVAFYDADGAVADGDPRWGPGVFPTKPTADSDDDENAFGGMRASDEDAVHGGASGGDGGTASDTAAAELSEGGDDSGDDDEEEPEDYSVWAAASWRRRLGVIVDPNVLASMPAPEQFRNVATGYQLIYWPCAALLTAILFAVTVSQTTDRPFGDVPEGAAKIALAAPNAFFTLDLILRLLLVSSWADAGMWVVDLLSVAATWAQVLQSNPFDGFQALAPLRGVRLFLFTGLLLRTETFRDINFAIVAFSASIRVLILIGILFVIAVLLLATFVFLSERGTWDRAAQVWMRGCVLEQQFCASGQTQQKSPFQSIPDSLWLTIQVMTTVGYGDTVPSTTIGRLVTGVGMIAGIFGLAFPAMVLIGNLEQLRKDFFADAERRRLERQYKIDMARATTTLARAGSFLGNLFGRKESMIAPSQGARRESFFDRRASMASGVLLGAFNGTFRFGSDRADGSKLAAVARDANFVVFDEGAARASVSAAGGLGKSVVGDSGAVAETDDSAAPSRFREGDVAGTFSFMGDAKRPVTVTRRGEYRYEPILRVLCDPTDNQPVLSAPCRLDEFTYATSLTLVIDDMAAQELALEAVEAAHGGSAVDNGCLPCARSIYALEVALNIDGVKNVALRRRADVGAVTDLSIPLVLEVVSDASDLVAVLFEVRRALHHATLAIRYATAPVESATWRRHVPVTSIMLATTPLVQDLRACAVYASNADLWPIADRARANQHAQTKRLIAFVTLHDMTHLVYPTFRKLLHATYVIRNSSAFAAQLAALVALHCRQVRRHEVPSALEGAVYNRARVGYSEVLYEVDLDHIRGVDWPLGSVCLEFAERRNLSEARCGIADGATLEQPLVTDMRAFTRAVMLDRADQMLLLDGVARAAARSETAPPPGATLHAGRGGAIPANVIPPSKSSLFAKGVSHLTRLAKMIPAAMRRAAVAAADPPGQRGQQPSPPGQEAVGAAPS